MANKFFLSAIFFLLLNSGCYNRNTQLKTNTAMDTKTFFKDYAAALLSYSADNISGFYQVPLTVYSDDGILQVTKMTEVKDFWEKGVKPYKAQGITKSIPEIVSEEKLSKTIIICKVHWANFDSAEKETSNETNLYILSQTKQGLKISGLIIMTK